MRIALCKTGSVWWVDTAKANSTGEQNDSTGVAKILRDHGHDVCLFSAVRGEVEGCHHINWDWAEHGMPRNAADSTAAEVYAAYDKVVSQLEAWQPDMLIEMAGGTAPSATLDNHKGSRVFEFAVRYVGCALYTYHKLKLKRLLIVTDPRSFPQNQEMTRWPEVIPQAILSQCAEEKTKRCDGIHYDIKAVHAGCENWWSWGWDYPAIKRDVPKLARIIAHSHFFDARLAKNRDDVWKYIFTDFDYPRIIHGKGWPEHMSDGPISSEQVHTALQNSQCGPMIPVAENWVTAKLRQYALNGAVPLLYGRTHSGYLVYDARRLYGEDDIRFDNGDELSALCRRSEQYDWRCEMVEKYRERTTPNPKLLLDMVEHFGNGGEMDYERFGGYRVNTLL
jgi:hypothetical protein